MLATPWPEAFDDPTWGFELKWDGIRALAYSDGQRLELRSRNGNDLSGRYPGLASISMPPCVIDGEIVVVDEHGLPSFEQLSRSLPRGRGSTDGGVVQLVGFDVLEMRGESVMGRPLLARRELLRDLTIDVPIPVNDLTVGEGMDLFSAICARDLEGMVAKRLESIYQPSRRSADWRKVLNLQTARCLVGGYTASEAGEPFGALILGMFDGPNLRYVGRVGSGFSSSDRREIRSALDEMAQPSAFWLDSDLPEGAFCNPALVAHVQFRSWTDGGKLRGPVFKGFGAENPESVTWDAEGPTRLAGFDDPVG